MISPTTDGPAAVDFGIAPGIRPFTEETLSSLWIELVEEAGRDVSLTDQVKEFAAEMKSLATQRPEDDSATAAYAIAADISGDGQPLRDLVMRWDKESEDDSVIADPKLRNRLMMVSLLRLDRFVRQLKSNKTIIWSSIAFSIAWHDDPIGPNAPTNCCPF